LENRDYEIRDTIEAGKDHYKSQSFDQSILDLYNDGIISKEQAMDNATSASDLELKINGLSSGKISSESKNELKRESLASANFDDVFGLK
jgi:twitching motility protein PilT